MTELRAGGPAEVETDHPRGAGHLSGQRFKLRVWITSRLWAQVMIGMALGFGFGLLLGESGGLVPPDTADPATP